MVVEGAKSYLHSSKAPFYSGDLGPRYFLSGFLAHYLEGELAFGPSLRPSSNVL